MKNPYLRRLLVIILVVSVFSVGLLSFPPEQSPGVDHPALSLEFPSFMSVARAEGEVVTDTIQEEAGIAAYFNAGTQIDLNLVRPEFRIIETETEDYILGSVPVPDYSENHDVHIYIHKDGWFLAYYLKDDLVGKIVDWKHWTPNLPTKFEIVLTLVANAAGLPTPTITFYDFRYPNATKLLMLYEDSDNGDDFWITMPSEYVYYARGWSKESYDLHINNVSVAICDCEEWGDIAATNLPPDQNHHILVEDGKAMLVLLYRDSQ